MGSIRGLGQHVHELNEGIPLQRMSLKVQMLSSSSRVLLEDLVTQEHIAVLRHTWWRSSIQYSQDSRLVF